MNPFMLKMGITLGIGLVISVGVLVGTAYKFMSQNSNWQTSSPQRNNTDSNTDICPVCLKELSRLKRHDVITLTCKHKICFPCSATLFSIEVYNQRTCPLCRDVVNELIIQEILRRKEYEL